MTKTELRAKLTRAVNEARGLKTRGLHPDSYWSELWMLGTARALRDAADSIEEYIQDTTRKVAP